MTPALRAILFGSAFEPAATVAFDFLRARYRVGPGGGSTPDFAALPGLSVIRASSGYAETAAGNFVLFPPNVARITDKGLLPEEARTNAIPNSTMVGATASALPTGWSFQAAAGLTQAVVGTGVEFGLPYVDWSITGTASGSVFPGIFTSAANVAAAVNGQAWTSSFYARVVSGALPANLNNLLQIYSAAPTYLGITASSGSAAASFTRRVASGTIADASTAYVRQALSMSVANLTVVNVVIRVYAPQLEQGAFVTSPIPTTSAAATRAADNVSLLLSSTLVAPFTVSTVVDLPAIDGVERYLASIYDAAVGSVNGMLLRRTNINAARLNVISSSASALVDPAGTYTGAFKMRFAGRVRAAGFSAAANGSAIGSLSKTAPVDLQKVYLGSLAGSANFANGYIERLIIQGDTTDAELQARAA